MIRNRHSNLSICRWAVLACVVAFVCGCAGWASPESMRQHFDSLRDTRAVEMDERLSRAPVPVGNPFSTGAAKDGAE